MNCGNTSHHKNTKRPLRFGFALCGLLATLSTAPAHAFVNNPNLFQNLTYSPDIGLVKLAVNYTASTHTLVVSNSATFGNNIQVNNTQYSIAKLGESFNLTVHFDAAGNATDGLFSVSGKVSGLGGTLANGGTILSGSLNGFGFNQSGASLRFLFNSLAGNAVTDGLYGAQTAMQINSLTNYRLDQNWSYSSTDGITTDISPAVPEPGTLLLMLGGVAALGRHNKRRLSAK